MEQVEMNFAHFKQKLLEFHPSISLVFDIAGQLGKGHVFIAGGIVRDFIRGVIDAKSDVDLFISDTAYRNILEVASNTGECRMNPFGSERWYPQRDGFYYDLIPFSDFSPGLWKCRDIIDVLNQFDITVNAVAFDLSGGEFYNPVNGLRDINEKIIRSVRFDFPDKPVSKSIKLSRNSVLWFRLNHYAVKLGFKMEDMTVEWVRENSFRIKEMDIFKKFFFTPAIYEFQH